MVENKARTLNLEKAPDAKISAKNWNELLRTARKANGLFPQTFFVQGVLVGSKMLEIASKEGLPLDTFFKENPPDSAVNKVFNIGKMVAHDKYGFTSNPHSSNPNVNVWKHDKMVASETILLFGLALHQARSTGSLAEHPKNFWETAPQDQLLKEILNEVSTILFSEEITPLATEYKGKIGAFMRKYDPALHTEIPQEYEQEMQVLRQELQALIGQATKNTMIGLQKHLKSNFPEEKDRPFRFAIGSKKDHELFVGTTLRTIDPLRFHKEL